MQQPAAVAGRHVPAAARRTLTDKRTLRAASSCGASERAASSCPLSTCTCRCALVSADLSLRFSAASASASCLGGGEGAEAQREQGAGPALDAARA